MLFLRFSGTFNILVVLLVSVSAAKKKDLQIISVHKPERCDLTAENGDIVAVHYIGKLQNGQVFDASKESPIKFPLGKGKVIKGWDQGIRGMCVGEKRTLIIPSQLAYGANGVEGVIPAHATLVFDTELVNVEKYSSLNTMNIGKFLNFAIWPALIILIVVILYQRYSEHKEKIKHERSGKKIRKKKQ
ncbi:FK506-binding protein 2-like [Xenia sp. Carnegie-2017]|uniref:FK506-binding protein 2-like n=1 Tax=Xenia sp. Carnegie-2017 TaxID=2897299 RepID=UPI001F036B9F|nr:FK506-binding protein 2-like [Xenia sp. Carnegie-2017]